MVVILLEFDAFVGEFALEAVVPVNQLVVTAFGESRFLNLAGQRLFN
jgi:hypothetical protein